MKLYYSPASPYARKCLVCAHELGLADRIELIPVSVSPVTPNPAINQHNPLGKVPALLTDDGLALYDSRVICEYLNTLGGGTLIPTQTSARWQTLTRQALADGLQDAALLARYETAMRPTELRWEEWLHGQLEKIRLGLEQLERTTQQWSQHMDIGAISLACALGYLDFRHASYDWRSAFPGIKHWYAAFSLRPSMQATAIPT